jgi:hypothetical protein
MSPRCGDTLKGGPPKALRVSAVFSEAHASACRSLWIALALWCGLGAPSLRAQGSDPLRKTDLIRLLTGNTMTLPQIVAKVRRDCVSFAPTPRDRQDLAALGADTTLLRAIDVCVRDRVATPAAAGRSTRTTAAAQPAPRTPPRTSTAPPPLPVPALSSVPPRLVAVALASRVSVAVLGTANVGVALKRGTDAVSGKRLVLRGSARLSGSDTDAQAVTDERGIARFTFTVGATAGTTRLTVQTAGGDTLDVPAEVDLTVIAPRPTAPGGQAVGGGRAVGVGVGIPSAELTTFVSGMSQRGSVGETAAQPVVFEVRDGSGRPLPGVGVTFSVTNGQVIGTASNLTDSLGRARVRVQFGERAGVPTVVTGAIGDVSHDATLYPASGPPTRLVVLSGGNALIGEMVLLGGRPTELRIFGRDKFGNVAPLAGLRASSGDERIVRVTEVTSDVGGGSVTLTAGRGGSTGVVIEGSGLRADFTAQVHP